MMGTLLFYLQLIQVNNYVFCNITQNTGYVTTTRTTTSHSS